jgi:hypothetical protein
MNSVSKRRYFLYSFLAMMIIGCAGMKSEEAIHYDRNYVPAKKYVLTDPGGNIGMFRFHRAGQQRLPVFDFSEEDKSIPVSQREYRSPDGSYTLILPKLSGSKIIFDDSKYPGEPTARFIMKDENNWVVGIQSTKIRTDYPKDDSLLTEIVGKRRLAFRNSVPNLRKTALRYFDYAGRLVLEETIPGASLDLPFFLSDSIGFSDDPGNPVRINRCIVRNGYFIEISVYVVSEKNSDTTYTEKAALEISDYILTDMSFPK